MDGRSVVSRNSMWARLQPSPSRPWWILDRVTFVWLVASIPPLGGAIYQTRGAILPLLGGSLVVSIGWTALFAILRGRKMDWFCIVTATVFVLVVPPVGPLWQALLALSFGIVLAEQIFGGRGYGFVHPAVAALAFLFFSFPGSAAGATNYPLVLAATGASLFLLLVTGLTSWRILAGVGIGLSGFLAVPGSGLSWEMLMTSSLALGVVFFVCDPPGAAATNAGRWVYGLLVGILIVILGTTRGGVGSPGAIVFAALLGSIFAPLIDRIVMFINAQQRRRRLG